MDSVPPLTARETEIVYWLAQGKTAGETASILGLVESTVKNARSRIYDKLGLPGKSAVQRWAQDHGIGGT